MREIHDVAHTRWTLSRTGQTPFFAVTAPQAATEPLARKVWFEGPITPQMAHELRLLADAVDLITGSDPALSCAGLVSS